MGKTLRVSASILLTLSFLQLAPALVAPASAAACSVTTGTLSGNSRYAIINSGTGCTWNVPTGITTISYLAVGGGGGGGGARSTSNSLTLGAGGGGAGGVVISSTLSTAGGTTFTLTVGSGGSAGIASGNGGNGGATTISYSSTTLTANGGNGGGGASSLANDSSSLSGDGGSNGSYTGGFNNWDGGGGGAGSGGAGVDGTDIGGQGGNGGNGGLGTLNTLLGANNYYGGGGGGGGTPSTNSNEFDGTFGTGGSSVGGSGGGVAGVQPTAGAANTGSGGGGGGWRSSSADGLRAGAAGAAGKIIFVFTKSAGSISGISITSNSGSDSTYAIANTITVTVTTSEAVTVTGSPRIPVLGLSSKYFTYSSGSGSTSLLFTYAVALSDSASAGVGVTANSLELNAGTLLDTAGLVVTITHSAVAQSTSHKVDGIRPTVSYVSSNTVAENETKTVALTLSELGSISLSSGYDRAQVLFDTSTNIVTFAPHNFENPLDDDTNNQYYINFTISDAAGNAGNSSFNLFVTVTNVAESAVISAPSLSNPSTKGIAVTLTITSDVPGKVDFFWGDKRIAGCSSRPTSGSAPNFTATCSWKPAVMTRTTLTARIRPTDSSYLTANSAAVSVLPVRRSSTR